MDPWSSGRKVARGVLRSSPKPEKRPIFCHRRGIKDFLAGLLHSSAYVFVSDVWPAPATYHRSFCEHRDQRVGRSPERARPVQISWRGRWFCRSMSVEDSESRRFELTYLAEFFSGRSWPKIGPGMIFSGFSKILKPFFRRLLIVLRTSGTESFGGYL